MKMIKMVKICFAVMMIGICVSCGSGQGKKRDLSVMTVIAHFGKTDKDIRSWLEMKQEDMTLVREEIPELVEFIPDLTYENIKLKVRVLFDSDGGGMKQFFYLFAPENKEESWDVLMKINREFRVQEGAEKVAGTLREATEMPSFNKDREYSAQWLIKDGDQERQYKIHYFYQLETDSSLISVEEI